MHAITVRDGALGWEEIPTPAPGPGEVRIRVAATAVNRADLMQRAGHYPPPPGAPETLGLECSGIIDAVGPQVRDRAVGDEVCALLAGGGYAEYVVVPAGQVMPVPRGVDGVRAAALPEVWATAWLNLVMEAGMQRGDRVLLHAGASGVGTAAIQICRELGAEAYVTAGSAEKIARCVALGAVGGANRHDGPWEDQLEGPFDIILDPVGAGYLRANLSRLAVGGRLVVIGLLSGREAPVDLGRLMIHRQRIIGSVLRARSVAEKTAVCDQLREHLWPLFAARRLEPEVHGMWPITEADAAHAAMASNQTTGKLILVVS